MRDTVDKEDVMKGRDRFVGGRGEELNMANVHIRFIEDDQGDLTDLEHFHHGCSPPDVLGWPAPEAVDYPVYCAGCGERVEEVPLTEAGAEMAS